LKVKEFAVKKIPISSIKFDKTNPNVVSDDQMEALSIGMKKFGYLAPVILNEKLQVLDGEHRVKVYEKLGEKDIPAYVINANKLDGKMLRQIMNKLRGEHDIRKDTLEYQILKNADKLDEFADLIGESKQKFLDAIETSDHAQIPEEEWQGMPEFMQDENPPFRRIVVSFDNQKDVDQFAKQVKQKLTDKTRGIWFPFKPDSHIHKQWQDES
jgi:hypothetical protein